MLALTISIANFLTPTAYTHANEKGSVATDIKYELNNMGIDYYQDVFLKTYDNATWYNKNPKKVSTDMTLNIDSSTVTSSTTMNATTPIYVGENEFINNTSDPKIYLTTGYEKIVTETKDITTTKPILGLPSNFAIDILVDQVVKKWDIKPASTDTVTVSDTKVLKVPSQPTKVNPGKSIKISVLQYQNSYDCTVKYEAIGTDTTTRFDTVQAYLGFAGSLYQRNVSFTRTPSQMFNSLPLSKKIKYSSKGMNFTENTVSVDGEALIKEVYGSKLVVQTWEADLPSNEPVDISSYSENDTNLIYNLIDTKIILSEPL